MPAGQSRQVPDDVAADVAEYFPAPHSMHSASLSLAVYLPAMHAIHVDDELIEYSPATHVVHVDDELAEYVPAEQFAHAIAPARTDANTDDDDHVPVKPLRV